MEIIDKIDYYLNENVILSDLKGAIEFSPKFSQGYNFYIKKEKIYRNDPKGEGFIPVTFRNFISETGLSREKDVVNVIKYWGGDWNKLIKDLKDTGKFHIKNIK